MPRVIFTANLKRHVDCPVATVSASTVRAALDAVFEHQQVLRGYVLDDQQRLRRHVTLFIDGQPVVDRESLSDAVQPESEIYVMQALSGG